MESRRNGPQLSSRHDDDDDCSRRAQFEVPSGTVLLLFEAIMAVVFVNVLLQGSESAGDAGSASATTVVDLEIKMEDLRQALRKAQVLY